MSDRNGDYRQIIQRIVEAARLNLEEHEKIWSAVNALRISHIDLVDQISNSTNAIRDLIDHIPPELPLISRPSRQPLSLSMTASRTRDNYREPNRDMPVVRFPALSRSVQLVNKSRN
jgi:hypothetical protein